MANEIKINEIRDWCCPRCGNANAFITKGVFVQFSNGDKIELDDEDNIPGHCCRCGLDFTGFNYIVLKSIKKPVYVASRGVKRPWDRALYRFEPPKIIEEIGDLQIENNN